MPFGPSVVFTRSETASAPTKMRYIENKMNKLNMDTKYFMFTFIKQHKILTAAYLFGHFTLFFFHIFLKYFHWSKSFANILQNDEKGKRGEYVSNLVFCCGELEKQVQIGKQRV